MNLKYSRGIISRVSIILKVHNILSFTFCLCRVQQTIAILLNAMSEFTQCAE